MGALCSSDDKEGGHALGEAQAQAYSVGSAQSSPTAARVITKKMPPSWTEKITRQKMKEIHGEKVFASVNDYEAARASLIARENAQAFDGRAIATASAGEKRANELVAAIRKSDETDIYEAMRDRHGLQRAPADHFLGNVDLINKTELLKVAKRMPKGAHLHCHFNSCLRPEFLIQHARGREAMYIRSTCPLTSAAAMAQAEISFLIQAPQPEGVSLFSENYVSQTWTRYTKFCEEFDGGIKGAEDWLVIKMLLNEEEVYNTYQTGTG
jgi:adenosine deaminase CECR1